MILVDLIQAAKKPAGSQAGILELQWKNFQKSLEHAYEKVPFYRQRFDAAGIKPGDIKTIEDLPRIPITTKRDLRAAGDTALAEGVRKENLKSSTSTGSTGQPTTTYFRKIDWLLLKHLMKYRSKRQGGLKLGQRIVRIDDGSQESARRENQLFLNRLLKIYTLSVDAPIEEHVPIYQQLKPEVLYGMPTYFRELNEYVKTHNLDWFRPKIIFTSGEITDAAQQRELESTLGCKTIDIYGTTEFKEVAYQCPAKTGYHINADTILVEFLNDNKPVGSGEEGDIVITSFKNRAMPLIRFDVGDRGTYDPRPCSCGNPLPLMNVILGRSVDYFTLAGGRRVAPFTLTNTLQSTAVDHIFQYQIIQKSASEVVIHIVPRDSFDGAVEDRIRAKFNDLLGPGVEVSIQTVESIPREPSGKYRVVKSYVQQ